MKAIRESSLLYAIGLVATSYCVVAALFFNVSDVLLGRTLAVAMCAVCVLLIILGVLLLRLSLKNVQQPRLNRYAMVGWALTIITIGIISIIFMARLFLAGLSF